MDNAIVAIIVLGLIMAVATYVYGLVVPPLLGRPRYTMPPLDIAFLAIFFSLVIVLLRATGLWSKLMGAL
jgi:hypothetical protein